MAIGIPGQSRAGPVATGQAYAQSIAGGMPMEQVIAPGVSYSPEMAGGYTQKDLDMIAAGPAPVMPIAPTTGEVATIPNQMPYAPPGVTQPTPFPAVGNFDFLTGLDFSNLPDFSNIDFSNIDIDAALQEYSDRIDAGEPEPLESFFTEPSQVPVMPQIPAYQEPVNFTAVPQAPVLAPVMPSMPGEPEPIVQPIAAPTIPQIPNFEIQQLGLPMNFTGLPQMPFIPESIPQMPVMPQIPQIAYIPPASSFIQPRVEEIVSPIRSGGKRSFQQPGLFNLV